MKVRRVRAVQGAYFRGHPRIHVWRRTRRLRRWRVTLAILAIPGGVQIGWGPTVEDAVLDALRGFREAAQ